MTMTMEMKMKPTLLQTFLEPGFVEDDIIVVSEGQTLECVLDSDFSAILLT